MEGLAKLIQETHEELKEQNKAFRKANKDAIALEEARRKAKGKQVAVKKASWEGASKRRNEEKEFKRTTEARLQSLVDKLPNAGEQRLSLKACLCLSCHPASRRFASSPDVTSQKQTPDILQVSPSFDLNY